MSARSQDWRQAADPRRSAWVSANAGAGKTHTLANRVTRLLLDGAKPAKILCLTFTKAAAAEMQHRLFKQLGEWSMLDDARLSDAIVDIGAAAPDKDGLRLARRLFAQALETPGGLKIQTLHGFCERLLSRFPLEAGIPASFQVLDDQTSRELIADARTKVLERAGSGDAVLYAAVATLATRAGEQSVMDILKSAMGANRGKLDAFVADKTPDEIAQAIAQAHGVGVNDTVDSIEASFCADLAKEEAQLRDVVGWLAEGSPNDRKLAARLTALTEANFAPHAFDDFSLSMLTQKNTLRKDPVTKASMTKRPGLVGYVEQLAGRVHAAKQRCLAAQAAALAQAAITVADAARRIYVQAKKQRGRLDYGDLIVETVRLLERGDAAGWVLYKLDEGLDHILIDEAQDTSPEQWRIVRKLTEEFFAGEGARDGKNRTVFAVGDEKQSIFSFQGADPKEFGRNRLHFEEYAQRQLTLLEEVDLVTSRRSTREILDFVDAVFASTQAREGITSDDHPIKHLPHRGTAKGRVEFWPLTPVRKVEDPNYWMLPLDVEAPDSPVRRLANEIALQIRRWCDGKTKLGGLEPPLKPEDDQPIRPRDIMILTPRREPFAGEIIKRLKELGVPVAGADRIRLTAQIGVMDLIALGRFVLLPEDDLNLASLLRSPLIGFSDEELYDLAQPRTGLLWNTLIAQHDTRASFGAAHAFLNDMLRRADFTPPHEFYAHVLGVAGGKRKLLGRLGLEAADAIDEFLSLALDFEQLNTPSLEGFLLWIERGEAEIKRDMEREHDEVRVMTVHGAKGLEARIVILPDTTRPPEKSRGTGLIFAQSGVFYPMSADETPDTIQAARDAAHDDTLKEYRRLLYVALTRARDRLYICGFESKQKLKTDSWYSLMQDAAQSLGIETPRGEGTMRVFGDVDTEAFAGKGGTADDAVRLPQWARENAVVEHIRPRLIRPSDATGLEEPATLSPLNKGAARFRRGLLVHALLARLPEIAAAERRDIALHFLTNNQVDAAEAAKLADETLAVIGDAAFAAAFAQGSRAEVALVADLPELGDGARLNGRIDRLAVTDTEVLAIDFKTNRPPPRRVENVSTLYIAQMALYRAALGKIFKGKRIACALVWTEGPQLMALPDGLMDAEIARIKARLDSTAPPS